MGANVTRRRFVEITSAAAGLAVGSALLGGCSAGSASGTATAESAGHMANGAPKYQGAMNKAAKIDSAPDESDSLARFVVVSDTHLDLDYQPYVDRVKNMFEDIAQFAPDNDAIIVNGDITNHGYQEEFDKFAELCRASGFAYPDDLVLVIDTYGSLGWEVTVWETCVRFRMRDFLKHEFSDLVSAIYQF